MICNKLNLFLKVELVANSFLVIKGREYNYLLYLGYHDDQLTRIKHTLFGYVLTGKVVIHLHDVIHCAGSEWSSLQR